MIISFFIKYEKNFTYWIKRKATNIGAIIIAAIDTSPVIKQYIAIIDEKIILFFSFL
jgi:hypothetical protein